MKIEDEVAALRIDVLRLSRELTSTGTRDALDAESTTRLIAALADSIGGLSGCLQRILLALVAEGIESLPDPDQL